MRMTTMLIVSGILLMSGLVAAAPVTGEEALTLDLTSIPNGSMYYLKCSRSHSITDCGLVSLWEQTNGMPGLQTSIFAYGGHPRDPDAHLLA